MRVWIDDAHPIFRRGLLASLQGSDHKLVGESADFVPSPPRDTIDTLVFEADTHRLSRAVRHIADSEVRLVAVMNQPDEQTLYDAVEAGVGAILVRNEVDPTGLLSALTAVGAGSSMLPADTVPRLLQRAANGGAHRPRSLAPRELAVLELLADGNDTRGIANDLCYSERTVKNIVHDVLMKMNCRNRAHAVAVATRQGII